MERIKQALEKARARSQGVVLSRNARRGSVTSIAEWERNTSEVRVAPRADEDDDVIDLRAYWNVLVRRKWTLITAIAIALVVALLATLLATPIYRATLLLQIERESGKVLEYERVTPEEVATAKDFYQTQYELLQSRSLAHRVINQLGLQTSDTSSQDTGPSPLGALIGALKGWLGGGETGQPEQEPELVTLFLDNLSVSPVKNSRLVRIEYKSPDPEEAAAIANAMAENFINTTLERRLAASSYAKTFLEERIQQVRANLEDSERRLVAYGREREIVNLDDKLAMLNQKLTETTTQLVRAEAERIKVEAAYLELREEGGGSTVNVLDSPVVQDLKIRRSELEAQYQGMPSRLKPGYSETEWLKRQIAEITQAIGQESAAIGNSVRIDYEAKVRTEAQLKNRIEEIKKEILAVEDRSTDLQTLKREVETNRELYNGLLQRIKEIGVAAGISTTNISIVDAAETPRKPYRPSLAMNLATAIAIGLFGGALLALLFETRDDTVRTSAEVEKRINAPVLGVIPLASARAQGIGAKEIPLLPYRAPISALAEAYRLLRTSLLFATTEGAPKILHFTSCRDGEGKTTSATSTAITFAEAGSTVLLIDADLRNPSLHQTFSLPNSAGLTNHLAGDAHPVEISQPTLVKRLFAITSGPLLPNPAEMLSSAKMHDLISHCAEHFDYVIIDGPPVIALADALLLANLANATILVVEAGGTRIGALDDSIKRLRRVNAVVLGAVLAKVGRTGYGYGYGYDYQYPFTGIQDATKI